MKQANRKSAEELMRRYSMLPHAENGSYIEKHYPADRGERAASGLIYYYVAPGETTAFHRIDCDEYWCFAAGMPLEIAQIDENGSVSFSRLGTEEDCEPVIYFRKGVIFASRSRAEAEGTFLSCITVPRFAPEGFEMFSTEKIAAAYPQTEKFLAD